VRLETISYDGFDWDIGNSIKSQKHGVSLEEIEELFSQVVLYFEDHRHSVTEKRLIAVGLASGKRALFIAFTFRKNGEENLIRVISARYTHKKEYEIYETIKKNLLKK
jgi:uncharacterized DUF497 family protein